MNDLTDIRELKGIGDKIADLFNKVGVFNVGDLVNYYPRAYDLYEEAVSVKDAGLNERVAVIGTVKNDPTVMKFRGRIIVSFYIYDEYGTIEVKYFNAPYMAKAVKKGDKKVFRGFLKAIKGRVILNQPKIYNLNDYASLENTITPVYHLTKGLSNERIGKAVLGALSSYSFYDDYLTEDEINNFNLLGSEEALKNIHFPENKEKQYYARRRIVFDEFLEFLMGLHEEHKEERNIENPYKLLEVADTKRLEEALPYALTNAQKRVIKEIFSDLSGDFVMNRLVQGDVGSGKTIVSVMALLMNSANNYQGAMMAPTDVLARQHYNSIKSLTDKYKLCIKPVLLTGKMSAKERKEALNLIESGEANVIVGTHALFQEKVNYKNLSLVITDEQHRFGVKQREALRDKGITPHILVMSATPIPRTLAIILYGGISVSVIDELPKNRVPILTAVVNEKFREKSYEKILAEIKKGHQAYVICPMIEESEEDVLMLKSVSEHAGDLKEYFGDSVRVGVLHGKMKPDEKNRIMEDFKDKNYDILVSTTVIEVGIDVPNATVIMIENAERFGLSQLHQLRGRVGRGEFESYCILMSDSKEDTTIKRLNILRETQDGFIISKKDIELRGPGELNGVRQSGELEFGLGDIIEDRDILTLVQENLPILLLRKPKLKGKLIDFRSI